MVVDKGYTKKQHIEMIMDFLGIGEEQATFIYAIETGEIEGDIIQPKDTGKDNTFQAN